ncbi:MAG: hypothetical protein ACE5G0_08645 [Rhodothermales bacterium]
MNAQHHDASLNDSKADQPPREGPREQQTIDTSSPAPMDHCTFEEEIADEVMSLSEEQIAFYRARIESGFYRSAAVQSHIVSCLVDEITRQKSIENK